MTTASLRFPSSPITAHTSTLEAFGLTGDPFPADPARGAFVATSIHEPARARLLDWTDELSDTPGHEHSLGVITGEEGTGKTRLLAAVEHALTGNGQMHVVALPDVPAHRTDAQLLKAILAALGSDPVGRTGLELRGEVREVLRKLHRSGIQPGLLIDDADFKGSQLELIRNLLRDAEGTGLWIVLAGTPDLHDRMRRRRSLRGLMGPVISLSALSGADMDLLLDERINAVRTHRSPDALVAPEARTELHRWSGGNPGRLLRAVRAALAEAAGQGMVAISLPVARHVIRTLTIDDANEARAEVAASTGQPVQTRMPLPDDRTAESSSATTQQVLWGEEEPV